MKKIIKQKNLLFSYISVLHKLKTLLVMMNFVSRPKNETDLEINSGKS